MNKKIIFFFSLFVLLKSECVPDFDDELKTLGKLRNYDDCRVRTTEDELNSTGTIKCCHFYYEYESHNIYEEVHTCTLITQTEYDNIKRYLKDIEAEYKFLNTKIHCFGMNIKINLLIILILFSLI